MKDEERNAAIAPMMRELLRAIRRGDSQGVRALLLAGVELNRLDENGCNALFYALHGRHFDIAAKLLEWGADVDFPERHGWIPSFWAAFNGRADIVALLVARGADANVPTPDGDAPQFLAAYKGHAEACSSPHAGEARYGWGRV